MCSPLLIIFFRKQSFHTAVQNQCKCHMQCILKMYIALVCVQLPIMVVIITLHLANRTHIVTDAFSSPQQPKDDPDVAQEQRRFPTLRQKCLPNYLLDRAKGIILQCRWLSEFVLCCLKSSYTATRVALL